MCSIPDTFLNLKAGDIDPVLGKTVKEVIIAADTFIVYIDTTDIIQWATTNSHNTWGNDFGKIANEVSYWESVCNKTFKITDAYDFKCLLAEAYARILDQGDDVRAQEIIDDTIKRIKIQGNEVFRQYYIFSSLITTSIVVVLLLLALLNKANILGIVNVNEYDIFLCGLAGGSGAFLSTMIRAKNYEAEILAGKSMHIIDGFLRIIYGVFAGIIICLGIKCNIIFGFFAKNDSFDQKEIFIAIIGGASETLLPNIIKKIETKS